MLKFAQDVSKAQTLEAGVGRYFTNELESGTRVVASLVEVGLSAQF